MNLFFLCSTERAESADFDDVMTLEPTSYICLLRHNFLVYLGIITVFDNQRKLFKYWPFDYILLYLALHLGVQCTRL